MQPTDWVRRVPWSLLAAAALLVVLGWLGVARVEQLGRQSGGAGATLLGRHVLHGVVALVVATIVSAIDYRVWERHAYALFAGAIGLLLLVYAFPAINSAHRWIRLGPIGFQPSEAAKLALILGLARYLMDRENHRRFLGLLVPLGLSLVPVLLVLWEPDLGTAAVFLPVFAAMVFVAGARRADLAKLALVGALMLPLVWQGMSREQRSRVTGWLRQTRPAEHALDDNYQLRQAKRVAALGGLWGSAIAGEPIDDPAVYHLPEARHDFLFCIVREQFGLIGAAAVLGLFGWIVARGLRAAAATRDPFARLVATGFSALVAVEVVVNAGMTVGLVPVTGLPLPLLSYGGSGLLVHGAGLGLVASIAMRPRGELAAEPFRFLDQPAGASGRAAAATAVGRIAAR